ncbi:MAG: NfeD family protein, partial [Candidatus Acidiferrum sp.]
VGEEGVTTSALVAGQEGMIRIHGELWRAVSPQGVAEGKLVRVRRVEGLKLHVEPEEASAAENK